MPNTSWSFIDSNLFPDFTSNGTAGEGFAQPPLRTHIDAVISIDYYTVAKMLELTGPLSVPGYRITVDAHNFISVVIQHSLVQDAANKAILGAIAGPLMQRISTLPPDRWPALIGALNALAGARHLQAYFNNDVVEKEIDRVGWSGTLNPTGIRDYMMEVESNLGATKANWFVTRHITVQLTRNGPNLHHKVVVDLVNNTPYLYRPNTYYRAYIRLYSPRHSFAPSGNLRPVRYPNPAPPADTRLLDGWLPVVRGYGGHGQVVFGYDTPWPVQNKGEDQIYWQKQPGTLSDKIDVTWNDGNGHVYTVTGDLGQDRVITLTPTGVTLTAGQPAQAQLPSLSLG